MPTYSYACTACDHRFDAVQAFTDANLTECPACAGKLRKLFNSVGIVFKGSGFYRTDSRSGAVGAGEKGVEKGAKEGGKEGSEKGGGTNGAKATENGTSQNTGKKAGDAASGKAGTAAKSTTSSAPAKAS